MLNSIPVGTTIRVSTNQTDIHVIREGQLLFQGREKITKFENCFHWFWSDGSKQTEAIRTELEAEAAFFQTNGKDDTMYILKRNGSNPDWKMK